MEKSDSINELIEALSKAQAEFTSVFKESDNPAYRGSKYADMATVLHATQPALTKHGITVIQFPVSNVELKEAGIRTILAHKSGQFIEQSYMLPAIMQNNRFDAQSCGSAFTYARRYAYQSAVGVAAENDDDGNAAAGVGSKEAAKEVAVKVLRKHAAGDETVHIIPWKEGRVALSGNGVAIVRANLTGEQLGALQWITSTEATHIAAGAAFDFASICEKHNVPVVFDDPIAEKPKHTVETASAALKDAFNDPIIEAVKQLAPKGKKPFLSVTWNGRQHSCFDTKFWETIKNSQGLPAQFECRVSGQYSNIDSIIRIAGKEFHDDQNQEPEFGY